jgi:hypothetical protein
MDQKRFHVPTDPPHGPDVKKKVLTDGIVVA